MARTDRGSQPSAITADKLTVDGADYAIRGRMTPDDRDKSGATDAAKAERVDGVAAQIWVQDANGKSCTILEFTDGTYSPLYG